MSKKNENIASASAIADAIRDFKRPVLACELCGGEGHLENFHDPEIVAWLDAEPARGTSDMRAYYAYKRRERKGYPGFRKDVWSMMHQPAYRW
jgi:hypothetical protein